MPETLVELRDVAVSYGGLSALSAVTFRVGPAELMGIIGPTAPARRRSSTS